jgi:hypothetical protein
MLLRKVGLNIYKLETLCLTPPTLEPICLPMADEKPDDVEKGRVKYL